MAGSHLVIAKQLLLRLSSQRHRGCELQRSLFAHGLYGTRKHTGGKAPIK
jgi:hypothetical protein